jgi:predicted metal-dependent phosphotriesterase family hydrolase
MKILPVGAELFHADGRRGKQTDRQTDRQAGMMKLIGAYRNFTKTRKNCIRQHIAYTG